MHISVLKLPILFIQKQICISKIIMMADNRLIRSVSILKKKNRHDVTIVLRNETSLDCH